MAIILQTIGTVTVLCPHCKSDQEIDDLEIAVTSQGVDISTLNGQGDNAYVCDECGEEYNVSAECDLHVTREAR